MMLCLWSDLHLYYILIISLIIVLLNLFINSSYILVDIIQSLDSFTLFDHLSINDRLLTFYIIVSAI